jgi:hypothetical protein
MMINAGLFVFRYIMRSKTKHQIRNHQTRIAIYPIILFGSHKANSGQMHTQTILILN